MAGNRDIYDRYPDPVAQFNARVAGYHTRDLTGLPLGDVLGHSLNRLAVCYGILQAAHLASGFGRIGGQTGISQNCKFEPVGAVPQDWRGSRGYPAAHLAPCTLRIDAPGATAPSPELFNVFSDGVTRSYVGRLFARTELVHVLVNRADSRCEGTLHGRKNPGKPGMSQALARSCDLLVSSPYLKPREVFYDQLLPGLRNVASERLAEFTLERTEQSADAFEAPSALLDAHGRPLNWDPERADTRIHSPSPEAWKANGQAFAQVLTTYASTSGPRPSDLAATDENYRALRANEEREAIARHRTK